MRNYILIAIWIVCGVSGCGIMTEKVIPVSMEPVAEEPQSPMVVTQDAASLERRFQEPQKVQSDPLGTITEWSKRYEELSQQTQSLRDANTKLTIDNNNLQQEIQSLKNQLDQAKKEIEQANFLLEQTHVELSKWKADVLGFREEMRLAQSAQLTALTRILRILGAETVGDAATPPQETK